MPPRFRSGDAEVEVLLLFVGEQVLSGEIGGDSGSLPDVSPAGEGGEQAVAQRELGAVEQIDPVVLVEVRVQRDAQSGEKQHPHTRPALP